MGVRLVEGGVALGFGAGDALIAAKITKPGPGGIPWPVLYEGAGVLVGVFGSKVGVPGEVRDTLFISSLSLAGARLGRAAATGKLMSGPKAWGGDHAAGGDFNFGDPNAGTGGGARVRMLPAARGGGVGGGFSLYPVTQEAPGVAG